MAMTDQQHEEWMNLADELGMSPGLACDMYILAGMDADLVRKCSGRSNRLETMKCKIINERFMKLEQTVEEKGREDGCQEEGQGCKKAETSHT